MKFKKTRRGIAASPEPVESAVLQRCVQDLLVLLAAPDEPDEQDPLAALVGMPTGDPERPADPALARLLPDAYGATDPDASKEFRRYTEGDLRAGKRRACEVVLASLSPDGRARGPKGELLLDRDQAVAWLGCLNDLRLVLGTRLDVTEDLDPDELAEDDPRLPPLQVYGWLGWLQESLLECLEPRR